MTRIANKNFADRIRRMLHRPTVPPQCLLAFTFIGVASSSLGQSTNPAVGSVKWFFPVESHVVSVALASNNTAFVATWNETVYAVDLQTRQVRWQKNYPGIRYGSLVIAPDQTLLLAAATFRALDPTTGAVKWNREFSYGSGAAAVNKDGTIFVGAEELFALDLATGTEKWAVHRDGIADAPALSADGVVYAAVYRAGIIAWDAATGERRWSYTRGTEEFAAPIIGADGTVYARVSDQVHSLDGINGRTNWIAHTGLPSTSPVIGVDGTVYVGSWASTVTALDNQSGAQRWAAQLPSYVEAMALAEDGTLYVSVPGGLYAVNSASGTTNLLLETEWRFNHIHIAGDGTIILPTWGGEAGIVALHGNSPLAPSAWPKAYQNNHNSSHAERPGIEFTRPPAAQWLALGSAAVIGFYSPSPRPLQVQWYVDGMPIPNGTNEHLHLDSVQFGDAGLYSVSISNRFGKVTSEPVAVTVGFALTVRTYGPGLVQRDLDQAAYAPNTVVQLTAVPRSNRIFTGWSGDTHSPDPTLSVTLASNMAITASFEHQPGDVLWELPESFGATPALGTNGILYGSHWLGRALAMDARTGEIIWDVPMNGEVNISPSIAHDGTVFVGTYGSTVNALDGRNGAAKWRFNIGVCVHSCPAVGVDGTVYFAGNKVYAVDVASGLEKWSFETNGIFETSPAIGSDNTVYLGSWNGSMYAFDGATGRPKWSFPTGGLISSSPAVGSDGTNDIVYFGSHDDAIYALVGRTGAKRWEFDTGAEVNGSPVIGADGTVFVSSSNQKLFALHGITGDELWAFNADGYISESAVVTADGGLLVAFQAPGPTVACLEAATGAERWRISFPFGDTRPPTVGPDGTIYFSGRALYGNSPAANTAWPKAHGRLDNRGRVPANPMFSHYTVRRELNRFSVVLHSEPEARLSIEWTRDWNEWTPYVTITNVEGARHFSDPADGQEMRFYRARRIP